jgi:hypothetical protein
MVVAFAAGARADEPKTNGRFTGSEACGNCHEAELESWRATAHARAGSSLGKKARLRRCQTCHTTGDAPAGRPAFSEVGCEACHGAGAGYAAEDIMRNSTLARLLGATDLSTPEARAAVCAGCHRSATRLTPFDAEQAWQKVKHR